MKKISVVFGTRPEAIKLAPVIMKLKEDDNFDVNVCVTAQHREMLDQVLEIFEIIPDVDLNLMKPNQSLSSLTANIIKGIDEYFASQKPDVVIVQGDTTTVMAVSIVAFYHKIKVAHVEAGLRTNNKFSPFPEEINRVLTSRLSDYHFAPTALSESNLLKEGILDKDIYVTGNTVIDALLIAAQKVKQNPPNTIGLDNRLIYSDDSKYILITGHRRENFGEGFVNICEAISELADKYPSYNFIYPSASKFQGLSTTGFSQMASAFDLNANLICASCKKLGEQTVK